MKRKFAVAIALAAILEACSSRPASTPPPTAVPVKVGQARHMLPDSLGGRDGERG
jgi:predicted component of type VI protein secretion system